MITDAGGGAPAQAQRGSRAWLVPALVLLLAVLAALPALVGPGILNTRAGGDSPFLVLRTHQMAQSLRAGVFPVRWMPEAALGLGYPAFSYYAALPYYVSALGAMSGLGVLGGIKLAQLLGFVLAGGATYGLARALGTGRPGAVLASVAYTYAPFHLINVYVRGDALSEFYAMALVPLVLWLAVRLMRRPSVGSALALAAAYAALVLAHNISAMLASPIVVLWLLVMSLTSREPRRWRRLIWGMGALAGGLTLSAWFWLPALAERDLVQLVDQTTGYFHFAGHFRAWDLVQRAVLFDYTIAVGQDPFRMGLVQTLVTALGLVAPAVLWRRLGPRSRAMAVLVGACWLGTTLLITPMSRPLWDHLPLLEYAQFPWRLLAFQSLFGALMIGTIPALVPDSHPSSGAGTPARLRVAVTALLALLLVSTATARLDIDRLTLEEADVTPYRLMLYEAYSGNLGGTIRYEFLPREMDPRPHVSAVLLNAGNRPAPYALSGAIESTELLSWRPGAETWRVVMAEGGWVAWHTAAFPGWRGTLNGTEQGIQAVPGLGVLSMEVPAGSHEITLVLGRTRIQRWSERLSLVTALMMLGLLLGGAVRDRAARRWMLPVGVAIALLAAWVLLAPSPPVTASRQGPLVMDYARAPYLHHLEGGVQVGAAVLVDYGVNSDTLAPGEVLRLTSTWRDVPPNALLRVELIALTAHLYPGSPAWSVGDTSLASGAVETLLPLPSYIPPGLYMLRPSLFVDGVLQPQATMDDRALGLLALAPVQVQDLPPVTGPASALAAFGPPNSLPVITLREAYALFAPDERAVQVDMLWRSERQAPRNYQLSVRVLHPDGTQVAARDLPPLIGNYPTSLWQPGHLYPDSLRVPLPEDVDLSDITDVEIILYDGMTLAAIGTVAVPID